MPKRKLPILKPAEVVARLMTLGFEEVRQKGSHKQFRHADGRCTTVPFHKGRDISPILLRQIARDIRIAAEELVDVTPSPNLDPGLVRESSRPDWGWKGFSDEEATQCRADRGLASAG